MRVHRAVAIAYTCPDIFNNVYNAIAREARVMGRLTISRAFVGFKRMLFSLLDRICCFQAVDGHLKHLIWNMLQL